MVSGISAIIFTIACLSALGSVGFTIIENLRVRRFDEAIFRLGWIVVRKRLPLPVPGTDLVSAGRIAKEEGMFAFVDDRRCLFAPKWGLFSLTRGHRMFTLKGTAIWDSDGAEITARLPLGPTVFVLSGFVAWTAGSVITSVMKSVGEGILAFLFGLGIGIVVAVSHIRVERKSMDRMIADLEEIFGA
jgi:hypothetical protein